MISLIPKSRLKIIFNALKTCVKVCFYRFWFFLWGTYFVLPIILHHTISNSNLHHRTISHPWAQFAEDGNATPMIFFKKFILAPEKIPVPARQPKFARLQWVFIPQWQCLHWGFLKKSNCGCAPDLKKTCTSISMTCNRHSRNRFFPPPLIWVIPTL